MKTSGKLITGRFGLQTRMIVSLVLLLSLLMVLITLTEIRRERTNISEQMRKDGIALAKAYALGVENALLLGKAGLSRVTGEAGRTTGIEFLQIVDTAGTVIGHTDITRIGTTFADSFFLRARATPITALEQGKTPILRMRKNAKGEEIFCVIMPLVMLGAVNGVLELGLETTGITLAIERTNRQFLFIALAALGFGILFILIFARSIVKPIRHLADAAGKIAAGELDHSIAVQGHDEIGHLAASFGFMTQKLRENLGALRTTNEALQAQVVTIENLQAYIENILNSITIGIMTVDPDRRITYCNRTGQNILGQEPAGCIGKKIDDLFPPDHFLRRAFTAAPRDGAAEAADAAAVAAGDVNVAGRIISLNTDALFDQHGQTTGRLAAFEDVTELRQLQKRTQHTDTMTLMGRLAAGIAHEVRNPLGAVKTCAQFLEKNSGLDEKNRHFIDLILREAKRMEGLVSRLLNYARPDECDAQYADINAVVDNAVELAALRANQVNVKVEKHYASGIPGLFIDGNRLSQAVLNLLLNAVDAIDGSGTISVFTAFSEESQKVSIVIRDTGTGIPKELQEKIFDPFFTTRTGGTGLGLAIVQQIIFEHNGTIAVESKDGEGTVFTILLPVGQRARTAKSAEVLT